MAEQGEVDVQACRWEMTVMSHARPFGKGGPRMHGRLEKTCRQRHSCFTIKHRRFSFDTLQISALLVLHAMLNDGGPVCQRA